MTTIEEIYHDRLNNPSSHPHPDIFEHMPTLRRFAEGAQHITEFGTRSGNSTTAFLAGLALNGGVLHSYDIEATSFCAPEIPRVTWKFTQQDTGANDFTIEPTDILFIDSLHEYAHIMREFRQANSVRRYIILHDTAIDWIKMGGRGVHDALTAFLARNQNWAVFMNYENCNGLTVLART
jgi:hypothetical protein